MSTISNTPDFSCDAACQIAHDCYGLTVNAKALPSERDQNFQLRTEDGRAFVLKIANPDEDRAFLEAQNQAMARLQERGVSCVPRPIQTQSGAYFCEVRNDGVSYAGRLITWMEGDVLAQCEYQNPELLRHLGACVAEVDGALKGFDHVALHRGDFEWDLQNAAMVIDRYCDQIDEPQLRAQIDVLRATLDEFSVFGTPRPRSSRGAFVVPGLVQLGRSAIHNDANDYNVIVEAGDSQRVVGLIDFGDMVHSYTVTGLAIAIAYAMLDKADPLLAAAHIVDGYHGVLPLSDDELAVVYPMARARLAVSVCMAAVQQRLRPDDPYLSISQQPIRRTLRQLLEIHPSDAEYAFRRICGLGA